jgi:hypothetical protein
MFGFRVLIGSPDRLGQFFFLKSKRRCFSKKKKKVNGLQPSFWPGLAGSTGHIGFFLPLFFLQPGPVPAPDRPVPSQPAGPGRVSKVCFYVTHFLMKLWHSCVKSSLKCSLFLYFKNIWKKLFFYIFLYFHIVLMCWC